MFATVSAPKEKVGGKFAGPEIAAQVIGYVIANFADPISLDDLAEQAGMSRFGFCRKFHKECGLPPMRWLWNFRTILAAEFIALDPKWSLTDIAFSCGFTSSAHFSRTFKQMYGKSPSAYRKVCQAQEPADARRGLSQILGSQPDVVVKALTSAITATA